MDDLDFRLTPGVSMESMRSLANGQAWEAVVTHTSVDGGACVAGYGSTGGAAWTASGGTPAVSVTEVNAGAPACND